MRVKGVLGISAALLLGVTSCSGPTGAVEPDPAPASSTAAQHVPEPSRAPVAVYTSAQLSEIVSQVADESGRAMTVMPEADILAQQAQMKSVMKTMTVEPSQCAQFAVADNLPEGTALALGISETAEPVSSTALTLASGVDGAAAQAKLDDLQALAICEDLTVDIAGTSASTHIQIVDNLTSLPGARTYRADAQSAAGQMSMIMSQAVHKGVLISAVATGGASQEDAVRRTAELMDLAVALLK